MKKALERLRHEIAGFAPSQKLDDAAYKRLIDRCVVVLTAGGEGSRLKNLTDGLKVNKVSLTLPDGDTMIQRTIRMYRDGGIKRFVALVYHEASSIVNLLGNGSSMGVHITYSHDPERPVGKGGAVLNALLNGSIPRDANLIVHNPDDQIVDYPGNFLRDIVHGHMAGLPKGTIATAVVVEGTPYAYTGMKVQDGVVEDIEMYPLIPVPTHIGVTVFSPQVFPYFERLFDLTRKVDFEAVLFPALSSERRLYAVQIPGKCWIPVNDPKSLQQLLDRIKAKSVK